MENDYYSDEEEDLSIHSSFANFSNNKLPKINSQKKNKTKKIDNYFRKSRNNDLKNNIKVQKQKFSSPIIKKTKVLEEFPNFKTFSANHNPKKKKNKIFSNIHTPMTNYQTKTENENNSKNSSSIRLYNNNFSNNYINSLNNNNSKTLNQFKGTKKKITLKLTKKEKEFDCKTLNQSNKNYFNLQSDSSNNYNTEGINSDAEITNSLSNILLDNLDEMNSEISENNEGFFSEISYGSNEKCIIIPKINTKRKTIRNPADTITVITRTKTLYNPKELLNIKKQNTVRFNQKINNKNNILVRNLTKGRNDNKNKTVRNGKQEIIIVSEILNDYPKFIKNFKRQSTIIQKPFKININQYLNKQREKIKIITKSFEKINFNQNKKNFLTNIIYKKINNIIEETNKIKYTKKEKDYKELMKSIFKNFCQKSRVGKILKNFESFILNIFFSKNNNRLIPNFNYICNHFFDCYNLILYYIYDAKYKEKEFNHRKTSLINNNLKILDSIRNISLRIFKSNNKIQKMNNINKQFIHFYCSYDLPINEKNDNENKKERKKIVKFHFSEILAKKKRRISIHDIIQKSGKRKNILEESNKISTIIDEMQNKNIIFKFHETNKLIEKWNPLKKESIFQIKLVKDDTEEKMKMEKLDSRKQKLLKIKWRQDMEILKSLGGSPVSKYCSLMRTQELEKENPNTKAFNQLLLLLEKNQTELFFEQYRNLRFRDINHQEKYTGDTLLMRAIKVYNIHIMQFLLDKKCNINIQNYELNTALHYAYIYNRLDLINILIAHGADETIVNKYGNTPWECLKSYD